MSDEESTPIPAEELAKRRLLMAALDGSTPITDQEFEPGATVTVGSNSRNALLIDPRFELTAYTLITGGSILQVAAPLHVQATVWLDGQPVALKGFIRELKKQHPGMPPALPLASERFVVRYATGVAFLGRFLEPTSETPVHH